MTDPISIHAHDPLADKHPVTWREPDGDHNYRGTGTSSGTTGPTIWSPCTVCSEPHDNSGHGFAWRTCSYCGSIHPQDLLELTDGDDFQWTTTVTPPPWHPLGPYDRQMVEWADWKYGYPHKLYIDLPKNDRAKFYSRHLADHPDLIEPFNDRFSRLGIVFNLDPEMGLGWRRIRQAAGKTELP